MGHALERFDICPAFSVRVCRLSISSSRSALNSDTSKSAPFLGIELYVHEDEAGYMLDGMEWTMFERYDFASKQALIGNLPWVA